MSDALRAFATGFGMVLRSPVLLLFVSLATVAAAVPFGLVLAERLRTALANQPPISLDATEIDPEWWMEFRAHAQGLEQTFTPAIVGFAAPLDNLSSLLDGSARPVVVVIPVALYGLLWAFLWGGVLHHFHSNRRTGAREFVRAGWRHLPRFAVVGAAAAVTSLALYMTLHRWLFGPVYERLAAMAATERDAFFWRVGLYLVFGTLLAFVGLVADYTRVWSVAVNTRTVLQSGDSAVRFVRAHAAAVVTLYLLNGALFVALLLLYGLADRRFGGWRGVLLGQAYVVARLALRLTSAASEVALLQRRHTSRMPENAGPPAAT